MYSVTTVWKIAHMNVKELTVMRGVSLGELKIHALQNSVEFNATNTVVDRMLPSLYPIA